MRRREELSPAVESLEERNLQSTVPVTPAHILPYIEQENIYKQVPANQNGIIAILIG
jgi:hypothetical protein